MKVKKGEHYCHLSETHLQKEEMLRVQPTLQGQFEEKQNTLMFEPLVDKDSILKMIKGKIIDESEKPCRLLDFIKLTYPYKLKRKDLATFTGSCKAIFQWRLPIKNKDPESFNYIGKFPTKEAKCSLGEVINSIPTSLIGKLESIMAQPVVDNLTLCRRINQKFRWSSERRSGARRKAFIKLCDIKDSKQDSLDERVSASLEVGEHIF